LKEYLNFLKTTTIDIIKNIRRIISLAVFEYECSSRDMFFGKAWKIVSPFIQIGVYWLVFGIGIRKGSPIDGHPYVVWLTCGLTPWTIAGKCVTSGAGSIHRKAVLLTRSNIPTVIVPISNILSNVLDSLWTIAMMIVIFFANGCKFSWSMFNIIYYVLFIIFYMSALSLITSVLVVIARDFQRLIDVIMRFMFFLSPIFWHPGNNMPMIFNIFDKVNPFAYVIRGFRNCMLYNINFYDDILSVIVSWSVVVILYLIGVAFQRKLRNNILDHI